MSLVFSNPTLKSGIVEIIDRTVKSNSTSYPLAEKVSDVNLGMDRVLSLIFKAGGTWQFDDSNQTDYPIITTNLVSGQRDYSFVTDQSGNLILDIFQVDIANSAGIFSKISPVDVQSGENVDSFIDGRNLSGTPIRYDKTANAIFLDPIPNYNSTGGLKVYINRESTYFTANDTTKKPGFAGLFHKYLAIYASYEYASRNSMDIAGQVRSDGGATGLAGQIMLMEKAITDHYGRRERDTKQRLIPKVHSNK